MEQYSAISHVYSDFKLSVPKVVLYYWTKMKCGVMPWFCALVRSLDQIEELESELLGLYTDKAHATNESRE